MAIMPATLQSTDELKAAMWQLSALRALGPVLQGETFIANPVLRQQRKTDLCDWPSRREESILPITAPRTRYAFARILRKCMGD